MFRITKPLLMLSYLTGLSYAFIATSSSSSIFSTTSDDKEQVGAVISVYSLPFSAAGALNRRLSSNSPLYGGVNELYSSEPPDPERRTLKLAFLAATRGKMRSPKSARESDLDKQVWGRWQLVEESIDRPTAEDLAKYGAKLKPTYSKYEEDLLFDMFGSLMLTDPDTIGYGVGWGWSNLKDMYSAPTLRFRINRKGVGIDYDDYDDLNELPSMSFYSGMFVDGNMDAIEGVIQRNRDIKQPNDGEPRVVVNVGKFTMNKVVEEEEEADSKSEFKESPAVPRVVPPTRKFSRFRQDGSSSMKASAGSGGEGEQQEKKEKE